VGLEGGLRTGGARPGGLGVEEEPYGPDGAGGDGARVSRGGVTSGLRARASVSGEREKAMGVSREREEAMLRAHQVSSSEDAQGFFTRYEEGGDVFPRRGNTCALVLLPPSCYHGAPARSATRRRIRLVLCRRALVLMPTN